MVLGVHFVDELHKSALLVKNKGLTQCTNACLAAHFLLTPCSEGLQHLGGRVGKQWERQVVFGNEVLMRFLTILTYAIDLITCSKETLVVIAQVTCLGCATRSTVFGIEIENSLFA